VSLWPAPDSWLVLIVFVPLLASLAVALGGARIGVFAAAVSGIAVTVGLTALSLTVAVAGPVEHTLGGWAPPLGIRLAADGFSVVFLWLVLVVGIAVSVHAPGYFANYHARQRTAFWVLWLMLWAALNATLVSADLFNLYVALELTTLAAVPLAALVGGRAPLSAAMRYLLFALLGSLAYLLGVALLYGAYGSLHIHQLGSMIETQPVTALAAGLITAGLMVKAALFPLHAWLPAAHARAPGPVSALLSALVVKVGAYLLLRLWWWMFPALHNEATVLLLGAAGAGAILYGSAQAFLQVRLKKVVAYSTIAQLGYLLLVFPLASAAAWQGVVYHGLAHGVAKAALFLAAANMIHVVGHDRLAGMRGLASGPLAVSLFGFALASLSIMGLPPSAGFVAKWLMLRAAFAAGEWFWAALLLIAGLAAAAYLFRVLAYLIGGSLSSDSQRPLPAAMSWTPFVLALLAIALGLGSEPLLGLIDGAAPAAASAR
jgi:multicomponent Na+:H+ antiporter subunit D